MKFSGSIETASDVGVVTVYLADRGYTTNTTAELISLPVEYPLAKDIVLQNLAVQFNPLSAVATQIPPNNTVEFRLLVDEIAVVGWLVSFSPGDTGGTRKLTVTAPLTVLANQSISLRAEAIAIGPSDPSRVIEFTATIGMKST